MLSILGLIVYMESIPLDYKLGITGDGGGDSQYYFQWAYNVEVLQPAGPLILK